MHARVRGEVNDQIMRRALDAIQYFEYGLKGMVGPTSSFHLAIYPGVRLTVVARPRLPYV